MKKVNVTNYKDGYDLPVYGVEQGQFLSMHVPALVCITLSLIAVISVIVFTFKKKNFRTFFSWSKSERFVIYLAICDGSFNICHFGDHLHILITKDHVYPKQLCSFYGFMLAESILSQILMVNIISINAFVLIFVRKNINFGRYDYRLLLWTFGLPFLAAIIALSFGTLGPNGSFCYFDGVKGELAYIFFTTTPLVLIFVTNIILYLLTWKRIKKEEPKFKDIDGREARIIRASHRAARTMTMFVMAFFIQWWAMCTYGIVQISSPDDVPILLFRFVTTFSNIGGVLNGIVYIVIRKKLKEKHSAGSLEISKLESLRFTKMSTKPVTGITSSVA